MIKRDISALEGFPYRLLIISAVLALTLPVIYSTWEYYDRESTIQEVREEVGFIGQKAEQLFIRGENNIAVHEVNLDDGLLMNIHFVELGGQNKSWIKWRVGDYEEKYPVPRNISLVPVEGEEDPIQLTSGIHTLQMEAVLGRLEDGEKTLYIEVEKI